MRLSPIAYILSLVALLASCYRQPSPTTDSWDITKEQRDSISFSTTHHYSQNYNFVIKADTMRLVCQPPDELPFDSVTIRAGDRVVVADFITMPFDTIDTVWVKIARDQATQGWLRECELLPNAKPDNQLSQFIDAFSDAHRLFVLAILAIVLAAYGLHRLARRNAYIVHLRDIDSPYPALLAVMVATEACLYASIQLFAPESWRHFYYHPTLNPLNLPAHLALLITLLWAMALVALAAIDDIFRQLSPGKALLYGLGLVAVCAVNYVFYSFLTLHYVGYPLLVAYMAYAARRYRRRKRLLLCGACGAELPGKGVCPRCGANNE